MKELVEDIIRSGGINNDKYLHTIDISLKKRERELTCEIELKIRELRELRLVRAKWNLWYNEEKEYY